VSWKYVTFCAADYLAAVNSHHDQEIVLAGMSKDRPRLLDHDGHTKHWLLPAIITIYNINNHLIIHFKANCCAGIRFRNKHKHKYFRKLFNF
jgi:hypothetical protein